MNRLQIQWNQNGELQLLVDGRDLIEIVKEIELGQGVEASIAGTYAGLGPYASDELKAHFLGHPMPELCDDPCEDPWIVLLSDQYDPPGAWDFVARIEVSDVTVRWSEFWQTQRPSWKYDGLSFEFDRKQYEAALTEIEKGPEVRYRNGRRVRKA
jgi:hypothetical protein